MTRRATILTTLLAGSLAGLVGCPGLPCECDPDVMALPDNGAYDFSEIRVADYYDGGASEEWGWEEGSPWGDVLEGEAHMVDGVLTVTYRTDEGTFLVELEEQ